MKQKEGLSITIFWLIIIFHLDPGGYLYSYLTPSMRTISTFVSLVVAWIIFDFHHKHSKLNIYSLRFVKPYIYFIIVWNIYFFAVYYGFNNSTYPGFFKMFLLNPNAFFQSLIVIPLVFFSIISLNTFFRLLIWTTIVIGFFFVITTFTGIHLMDTWSADRNVGGARRSFMYGYGLIKFVIPIAITIIFLKYKLNKHVLMAFLMALGTIMITVWRRDIIGVLEHVFIISILVSYVQNKHFIQSVTKYLNLKNIVLGTVFVFVLSVFASNFVNNTVQLATGTLGSLGIIENTEGVSRTDRARMSLTAKVGIVQAIKENFLTGTGYDKNWFTGDGGEKGWEGGDYIFLAAFGMYGIVGLCLFLPFYVLSVRLILVFLKLVRAKISLINNQRSLLALPTIIGIAAASEFFKNILEYPNWFYPIGAIDDKTKYFIYFGLLLGSFHSLKFKISKLDWSK